MPAARPDTSSQPGRTVRADDPLLRGLTDDLRLAHLLADDADSITMSRFKALDLHVTSKPDLTPVTDADTAVEEAMRRTLGRARPRDAVHGEEMRTPAGARDAGSSTRSTAPRTSSAASPSGPP